MRSLYVYGHECRGLRQRKRDGLPQKSVLGHVVHVMSVGGVSPNHTRNSDNRKLATLKAVPMATQSERSYIKGKSQVMRPARGVIWNTSQHFNIHIS